MEDRFVSPKFTAAKLDGATIDDEIDVFEDQFKGWLFSFARQIAPSTHSGFAVLSMITSYFEAIAYYLRGSMAGNPNELFRVGLWAVDSSLAGSPDEALDTLYGQLRCGLYHESAVRPKVAIQKSGTAVHLNLDSSGADLESAVLDPWALLELVENHFNGYLEQLRDPTQQPVRERFEKLRKDRRQANPKVLITFIPERAASTYD